MAGSAGAQRGDLPPRAATAGGQPAPAAADVRPADLRVTLRVDVGGRATLGPGKVKLLELIGRHGSISAAGRGMGMSYRRAWSLVEALNATFEAPLVAARPGGAGGGGAELLPLGREVVDLYRALEASATTGGSGALRRLAALLRPRQDTG